MIIQEGVVTCMDCLEGLKGVRSGSVSMVFADLPYGRTQNTWDKLVPMDRLWPELNRVCRSEAAMVFTSMQPFTSLLVSSNIEAFRYETIWRKNKVRGFLNSQRQPLRVHENVLVFYRRQPRYVPQMSEGHRPVNSYTKHTGDGSNYGKTRAEISGGGSTSRYPTSILDIPVVNNDDPIRVHSTQKPEELVKWFVLTYTRPGDLILDPVVGSGTTLVVAKRLGRRFIGFETDKDMVAKATARLAAVVPESGLVVKGKGT